MTHSAMRPDIDRANEPELGGLPLDRAAGIREARPSAGSRNAILLALLLAALGGAAVDNLPRRDAPMRTWPIKPATGALVTAGSEAERSIAPANGARYAAYVDALQAIDTRRVVDLYVRAYPMFQRTHQELGYPHGYFNDRMIEAIDDLLDAPEPKGPVKLVQSKVMFEFADADLESRSSGQKMMMRIGFDNEVKVKRKLRAIHDELMRRELPR